MKTLSRFESFRGAIPCRTINRLLSDAFDRTSDEPTDNWAPRSTSTRTEQNLCKADIPEIAEELDIASKHISPSAATQVREEVSENNMLCGAVYASAAVLLATP